MRIIVHKNERGAEGKIMHMDIQNTSFDQLKRDIAEKVGMKQCRRVFISSGAEITNINEIHELDLLYVSAGEDYFKQTGLSDHFAISVVGAGGVGKSALTLRFVRNSFINNWDPTIEDAYSKPVEVDHKICKLDILDTAGQEDFESLRYQWMLDKDGYLFVFSLDNRDSLKELDSFFHLHSQLNSSKQVPIVVCGNKADLISDVNPVIPYESIKQKVAEYHAQYLETSALTGNNVNTAFETLIREIRNINNPKSKSVCPCGCCDIM